MLPEVAVSGKLTTNTAPPITVAANPTGRPSTASKKAASSAAVAKAGVLPLRPRIETHRAVVILSFMVIGIGKASTIIPMGRDPDLAAGQKNTCRRVFP